jgi:hypothetical protein
LLIAILSVLLFAANFWISSRLFRTEYTTHMGSIEGAYVGLSRYMMEHWGELTWFPLWYGGVPFANTYPPFLHWVVALVAKVLWISPALAHHAVSAFFYCLGPVALFWLVLRLGGWWPGALFAGLLHSAVSISQLAMTVIAQDAGGLWGSRRLQNLVQYGEGPHITALALLPIAILLLDRAVERRRAVDVFLACVALGAVTLTNWLGAFALGAAALCYVLARWSPETRFWRLAVFLGWIGVLAYLFAGPWLPPSMIASIRANAATIEGDFRQVYPAMPRYAAFVLLAAAVMKVFFRRWGVRWQFQFAGFFAALMAAIPLLNEWFGIALVPQPHRYQIEMEIAVCFAAGLALGAGRRLGLTRAIAVLAITAVLVYPLLQSRRKARGLIEPLDIRTRVEYQMARWMDQHIPRDRVAVPGATSFWFLAFSDTPQLGGGFEQGVDNYMVRIVGYLLTSGDTAGLDPQNVTLQWLKAFGVHYVGAGGPQTREWYKGFARAERWRGWKELWREGDDAVYEVPSARRSLARVIRRRDVVTQQPVNGIDISPLRDYVSAIEDPALPDADWQWSGPAAARINAKLEPHHLVSIQESYHPGWSAKVNGRAIPVSRDGLGLMVLDPECSGACTIEMKFDGGREMMLLRAGHVAAWFVLALWFWRDRKRVLS